MLNGCSLIMDGLNRFLFYLLKCLQSFFSIFLAHLYRCFSLLNKQFKGSTGKKLDPPRSRFDFMPFFTSIVIGESSECHDAKKRCEQMKNSEKHNGSIYLVQFKVMLSLTLCQSF